MRLIIRPLALNRLNGDKKIMTIIGQMAIKEKLQPELVVWPGWILFMEPGERKGLKRIFVKA